MQVDARGLTFQVHSDGPDGGVPVVLLHGFPQHSGEWDLMVPALRAAGVRSYAVDQRGYSPGARPDGAQAYRIDECAADVLAVMDALDLASAHVVGHDWGALVGWRLAASRERIRTLTAISVPHPLALAEALASDADQRERMSYVTLFRREGTAEEVLLADDAARLRGLFGDLPPERVERYVAPMREPGALTAALNWYRAMSLTDPMVGPVTVPTTFVWSDGDAAIGRRAAEYCSAYATEDYRFVPVAGVSHWVPDEAPDVVAEAVLSRIGLRD